MNGKVDKTIVKSILVAFGIIAAICCVVAIIIHIIDTKNAEKEEENYRKSIEDTQRAYCMNEGGCWVDGECQNPCSSGW